MASPPLEAKSPWAQEEFLLRQALAIRKRIGGQDANYAVTLGNLAITLRIRGERARAETLLREASDILRKESGEKETLYAWTLRSLATLYEDKASYAKAETLYRQALAIYAEVLGKENSTYAEALGHLANLYEEKGNYAQARSLFEEVLQIQKRTFGESHPAYADALDSLGWLYLQTGEYGRAEALLRQVQNIRKLTLGENHPRYAEILRELAWLYQVRLDYSRAEPLYRQGLAIMKRTLGDKHPDYTKMLDDAGGLYLLMGDDEQALALRRQALEVDRHIFGEKHPRYAAGLNNLALVYEQRNDHARAEKLYRQAVAIQRGLEENAGYATTLQNLGSLYDKKGDYAAAEPLLRQAVELRRRILGEKHPQYALVVYHLGWLHYKKGEYTDAQRLLRQALATYQKALGEQHPYCAICLQELAELYAVRGDYDQAEALAHQGLEIDRKHLEQSAVVQSERQQLAAVLDSRHRLDTYLAIALRSRVGADHVYDYVLAWKRAVSSRQTDIRALRRLLSAGGKPEVAQTYEQLVQATARLAALANAVPDPQEPDRLPRDLEETSKEIERLEKALADASAAFRTQRKQKRQTAADIRAVLPPGTVLVDLLDYWDFDPKLQREHKKSRQRRFIAFVVRPDHPQVIAVDLGPVGPIHNVVARWRLALQRRFHTIGDADLDAELRHLFCEPLTPHFQGAKTVLISPDGALARIPWGALPGKKPDTYLIEDVAVAIIPAPARLPELLAADRLAIAQPALLLVGDVRYDAAPGQPGDSAVARAAPSLGRAGVRMRWPALPGTGPEVEAIKKAFRERFPGAAVTELRQAEATEAAVRREALRYPFLHFATHGYFAPPQLRSALAAVSRPTGEEAGVLFAQKGLAGFHPSLLSGVVLAGANQPLDFDHDDGILTALEVEALDLTGAELVTLSACETGLGEQAGGEGLLGLQRSFQVAGARSVVAGLWQVDDAATRKLMELFYANLWQKKLPKQEALRQAQLWLLRKGDAWMRKEGLRRGLEFAGEEGTPRKPARTPPLYWAAFVLSGDWR